MDGTREIWSENLHVIEKFKSRTRIRKTRDPASDRGVSFVDMRIHTVTAP